MENYKMEYLKLQTRYEQIAIETQLVEDFSNYVEKIKVDLINDQKNIKKEIKELKKKKILKIFSYQKIEQINKDIKLFKYLIDIYGEIQPLISNILHKFEVISSEYNEATAEKLNILANFTLDFYNSQRSLFLNKKNILESLYRGENPNPEDKQIIFNLFFTMKNKEITSMKAKVHKKI